MCDCQKGDTYIIFQSLVCLVVVYCAVFFTVSVFLSFRWLHLKQATENEQTLCGFSHILFGGHTVKLGTV